METHDVPFAIINSHLRIVAVNQAWELASGISRTRVLGYPCCDGGGDCRHQQLFKTLAPYAGVYPGIGPGEEAARGMFSVRGYPLINHDSGVLLGEALRPISRPSDEADTVKMVGNSAEFKALKARLAQASRIPAPVMLLGETGTGKELAAEYLHGCSTHAAAQLVVVDCTILGEDLFESELFGHEKGAFTGATMAKKGLFEIADNGTIFLDEIGELPLSQQAKLLRVLETGKFRRVGGTTTLSSQVRVICATHRNLAEMVSLGRFREDLFYRLSVFPIKLPSLRERGQDIPVIVDFFLQKMAQSTGISYTLTRDALVKLVSHKWPGNIRELKNCLQLAVGLSQNELIRAEDIHFMESQILESGKNPAIEAPPRVVLPNTLNEIEKLEAEYILNLQEKFDGSRRMMAAEMNISERTLYRKLIKLNLHELARQRR